MKFLDNIEIVMTVILFIGLILLACAVSKLITVSVACHILGII